MLQCLREDHQLLRAKLDALEFLVEGGDAAVSVIRGVCFSLKRRLLDHLQREQRLLQEPDAWLIGARGTASRVYAHALEALELEAATQLLIHHEDVVSPHLEVFLQEWVVRLRNGMDRQEGEVFDLLDVSEAFGEGAPFHERMENLGVRSDTTVHTILRMHPETRPMFERHGVNLACERYEPLEEVAWRRGADVGEWLRELSRAITPPARWL